MIPNKPLIILSSVFVLASTNLIAQEFEVGQKNKAFTTELLKIKAGDSVKFTNEDPFFHNIYSLSELKTFDLGSYPKGQSKTVTFDEPGSVEVECAIHPNMFMTVEVQ